MHLSLASIPRRLSGNRGHSTTKQQTIRITSIGRSFVKVISHDRNCTRDANTWYLIGVVRHEAMLGTISNFCIWLLSSTEENLKIFSEYFSYSWDKDYVVSRINEDPIVLEFKRNSVALCLVRSKLNYFAISRLLQKSSSYDLLYISQLASLWSLVHTKQDSLTNNCTSLGWRL